ncbi:MAG TPA: hypothetical protein GX403_02740 [Rhodocyclaceae bacterium]|nr:hypothetical protein [Rhodocyclaceae bacterium]
MSASDNTSQEKRRRLIKSAAVAPVVLTLPSGSALAASSAMCDQKSADAFDSSPAFAVTTATDRWMRAQLQMYTFKGKVEGQNGTKDYSGFKYNINNNVNYAVIAGVAVPLTQTTQETLLPGQYFYVLVDYRGDQPVGLILDSSSIGAQNPIAGASCWNSLTGDTLVENVITLS